MNTTPAPPKTVLTIGPPPDWIGGMSTVIGQIARLDLAGRYQMAFLPITVSSKSRESRLGRVVRHVSQRRRLAAAIRREKPAIVHLHTCSGFSFHRSGWDLRVAARRGCRTILHVHGASFDEYYASTTSLEQRIIRWTLNAADRVIALSEDWRTRLLTIAPHARVNVIENAVDAPTSPAARQARAICRFLVLAKMDEWKGIDDLLDACALLRRRGVAFGLTLAGPPGTAGDAEIIQRKIVDRALDVLVQYVGPAIGDTKAALLADADVYVQPSHNEGMPIAVLEAMANGLPVIATAVGAMPEVIEDEIHGLIVPPRQPEALATAMGVLAFDIAKRTALGEAARQRALVRFGLSRFRDDLLALYDDVLRSPHGSAVPRIVRSAAVLG